MFRKILSSFILCTVLFVFFASTAFAGGGKIVGKVLDSDTKEPLIGASIVIKGTSLGAATNLNGEYMIINVPPGTYTIKASYVGYSDVTVENVRIYADLTSQTDFSIRNKSFQTKDVVIVADKPLINKNQTNATSVIKAEDLENLPVRSVEAIVANQTGVVRQNGNIYVRGSRSDAVAFYVDGVQVTDPMFGGSTASPINNSIEEIQFQAGGYTAEYGGANAGIISTTSRSGSEEYKLSFEGITDNFVSKGSNREMLGGYSYGYSEYVVTLGGPLIPSEKSVKFYLAASNNFQRSPIRYWDGVNMPGLFDPSRGSLADTLNIVYPKGYRLNQASESFKLQGNLTADWKPLLFKLSGSLALNKSNDGGGIAEIFNYMRVNTNEGYVGTVNLKTTYVVSNNSFIDLNVNYYKDYTVNMDPSLQHNIIAYGDSVENAKYGYTLRADGVNPTAYAMYGSSFNKFGTEEAYYQKRHDDAFGGKLDFFSQVGSHHEFKMGGDYKRWTIRRYLLNSAFNLLSYVQSNPDASPEQWYQRIDNYGYDIYGNVSDAEGKYAPKHPEFLGLYIQDKMEYNDLVVNAGLRYDYIFSDSKVFDNPSNISFDKNGNVDYSHLIGVPIERHLSPRLGFSFSLTDKAKFHAQYGKFIQQSRLRDIYQGLVLVGDNIKGGYAISSPVGFGLRPEKTTSYDLGFSQQLGDNFALDVTAFYKDIKDQVQIRTVNSEAGAQHGGYYAFVNGDFSTTKGIEFQLNLRRIERVTASFNYTFSDARGTGSNPSTGFRALWQSPTSIPYFPEQVSPLDFNQAHRGNLNVDYRFIGDDGPSLLQNFGGNLLLTFNSGHNFTKVSGYANTRVPQETLNESATPWAFQLDIKVDKTVNLGGLNVNIYVLVINLLNTKNVTDVFIQTGSNNDGFLNSTDGKARVDGYRSTYGEQAAQNYINLYNAVNNNNADIYGTPRQFRLGVKLEY